MSAPTLILDGRSLGDIAQGTGPVPYAAWDELTAHLPGDAAVEELEHAYRVPREIMDFALPLLPAIAPDVRPPRAYRIGAEPPRVVADDAPLARAFAEAARLAGDDALVAVIAPSSLRGGEAAGSVFDDRRVPVLTPREAKGMDFDLFRKNPQIQLIFQRFALLYESKLHLRLIGKMVFMVIHFTGTGSLLSMFFLGISNR
jgi:hypothetical protein